MRRRARGPRGTIGSREWIRLAAGGISADEDGARVLGERYLDEVRRFTHGLVRPRTTSRGVELVLAGVLPLLRFGHAELRVGLHFVECRFPITGGLLAARPGGALVIAERSTDAPELELVVAGYFPRLGGSRRRRSLRRALYSGIQARAHRAVGRAFLERSAGEPRP